jgi:hypothetical protein
MDAQDSNLKNVTPPNRAVLELEPTQLLLMQGADVHAFTRGIRCSKPWFSLRGHASET